MDWKTYYERFDDWEESTQLRHLATLTDFGPSSEICELAYSFMEESSANRLIKKALAAGVRFSAEEIEELDGVVSMSLMPQLIKNTSHPLTAEQLDDFVFWLSPAEVRSLAKKYNIRLDEDGNVMTADMIEAELEDLEAEKEMEQDRVEIEQFLEEEAAAREEETLIYAKAMLAIISRRQRERRKKRREARKA